MNSVEYIFDGDVGEAFGIVFAADLFRSFEGDAGAAVVIFEDGVVQIGNRAVSGWRFGAEESDGGGSHGHGQVHRAGIVGDKDFGIVEGGDNLFQRGSAGEVDSFVFSEVDNGLDAFHFSGSADEDGFSSEVFHDFIREPGVIFGYPPAGAGDVGGVDINGDEGFFLVNSFFSEQFFNIVPVFQGHGYGQGGQIFGHFHPEGLEDAKE